jgi:hypothetical protein
MFVQILPGLQQVRRSLRPTETVVVFEMIARHIITDIGHQVSRDTVILFLILVLKLMRDA